MQMLVSSGKRQWMSGMAHAGVSRSRHNLDEMSDATTIICGILGVDAFSSQGSAVPEQ